ncbi:TetR/AcrR family transcriptional regulator [Mycobacterium shimoidei]|uniref:TetR family transcriptional regulator [Amycolatopsis mediterranei S699] n=1 Tax=Mycobacterium shimoidei TaxID=29313 RepID=A0A1E3TE83_MYCSH|nr:TetR/AcrR family transcriptional regulator [Mycobacterium shimoidei]MCV7258417.1 TetR/AcrR family transcriptional regulator [Mycobacterium shimoidei]ODR12664.1 TetR family transcriptional regulator [Mycobacterium shimoidei]ORW81770.1 TetR family transcriptional regulator [Mycobacterium shimoidei]SRX93761.1 TetR family transcriptional regulator [Amycolatopsis mediterranei S699] [Mycobacterium shimoidei]
MSRPRSDTRERIQDVARELFAQQGVQRTSLQDIADKLGITKPALYYHFSSREELVRSIVQPLIDDGEQFVAEQEAKRKVDVRQLLEGYFDFHYHRRQDLVVVLAEFAILEDLGLVEKVLAWRARLGKLVFGPKPTLTQATRAVIAFGGLQDCCLQFRDVPRDELRAASVEGALAALGI